MLRHEITPMLADTFALISMPQLLCILISSPQVVCRPYYTQTSTLTSGRPGFNGWWPSALASTPVPPSPLLLERSGTGTLTPRRVSIELIPPPVGTRSRPRPRKFRGSLPHVPYHSRLGGSSQRLLEQESESQPFALRHLHHLRRHHYAPSNYIPPLRNPT